MSERQDIEALIRYRSHRGMLELDLFLVPFADKHLSELQNSQLQALVDLLECQDPDIHAWLMGFATPQEPQLQEIVALIRKSTQ